MTQVSMVAAFALALLATPLVLDGQTPVRRTR
jgi:hypothetical protein